MPWPAARIRQITGWGQGATPLPESVHRELVATLFGMTVPIAGLGLLLGGVCILLAVRWQDEVLGLLAGGILLVSAGRIALILCFHHKGLGEVPRQDLLLWERRYASGTCLFALLLGLFAVRVVGHRAPMADLVAVSMVFTFGAGVVSRIASQLAICVTSLLLATVPTIFSLSSAAASQRGDALDGQLLAIESGILALVTVLSILSARYIRKVTVERLLARHELAQLVRTDDLTGLANRLSLRERLRKGFTSPGDTSCEIALLFLDLDGFKAINDTYGHKAGDAVLRQVADRLKLLVRASDTVARVGGDEFVVMQSGVHRADEAGMLARRIIDKLGRAYTVDGTTMVISVCIGIATGQQQPGGWEGLLSCADAALYAAKAAGRAQIAFYSDSDPGMTGRSAT